ncbi:hypothetical protein [Novosphingobium sp.]|uniref:hypothetical protein n=1 Tax=Novosphingobium sp. TaxID=1874826 RepID=UPI0035AF33E6
MVRLLRLVVAVLCAAGMLTLVLDRAGAAQRSAPGWWDPDGVGSGSDWHFRVPVTLPAASTVNSTAKVDIDFAALMTQLGISGTLDPNSIRVVRPGGTLATIQEYNDSIYAGASDSNASRGEVRWIIEDGGAQTYQVYFDVTANGTKAANPQTPINGNFEHSTAGTQLPAGWASAARLDANYDLQVRPGESVSVTSDGGPLNNPYTTDGSPRTGSYSYLLGSRSNNEVTAGLNATMLTRTFTVPASNPGNLVLNWRNEGWDSEGFDNLHITLTPAGGTETVLVGNSLGLYTTYPNSPNIGSDFVLDTAAGYGQYNGYDTTATGTHMNGMTVSPRSERWWSRTYSLAAFAGQTVTLAIGTDHVLSYRTWFHIDDIEWSVVTGTLGVAQGFGVAATSPAGSQPPGQTLVLRALVDAKPTAATNPVTAEIVNAAGTTVASGIKLFNDGTHGDVTANDAVWTNNGSDSANPTYTIPLNAGSSGPWTVRVQARGGSTSTLGAAYNGLVHRSGQPNALVMANWWNIDDASFMVDAAVISVAKTMTVVANGVESTNWKAIPGATLRYCVTIGNSGTASASTVIATDSLPAMLSYVPGSLLSGADCASAATAEDDNATGTDESDPVGVGYSAGTISVIRSSLPTGTSFAVTYRVTVN